MTEIIETTENMTPPTSNNSNGISNKLFWILLGGLGLILAGLLFYFFYWIKTPTYTVGIIKTAIEQKDMTTFEKHVDLDTLLGKAYLDSTRAGLAKPDAEESKKILAMAEMEKPSFIRDMKKGIISEIKSPSTTKDPSTPTQKSPFTFMEYRGTGASKTDGNTATVDIKIFNKKLGKEFILTLGMTKSFDGSWKVVSINNFADYENQELQATYEKTLEINKTKSDEIAKEIQVGQITLELSENKEARFTHLLKVNIPFTFLTDRNAATIEGIIVFYQGDKLVATYPLPPISGSSHKDKESKLTIPIQLTSFFAKENMIITTPTDQITTKLNITKVEFADKSTIELNETIPDPK